MHRRRRPNHDLVRITKRNLPTLTSDFAADIIRLRKAMHQAVFQIDAGRPDVARETLVDALRERWWR